MVFASTSWRTSHTWCSAHTTPFPILGSLSLHLPHSRPTRTLSPSPTPLNAHSLDLPLLPPLPITKPEPLFQPIPPWYPAMDPSLHSIAPLYPRLSPLCSPTPWSPTPSCGSQSSLNLLSPYGPAHTPRAMLPPPAITSELLHLLFLPAPHRLSLVPPLASHHFSKKVSLPCPLPSPPPAMAP